MTVDDIFRGLDSDPERVAEVRRFYEAIASTLNRTHDAKVEQDALCLFEAMAMMLGQLTGGFDQRHREGFLQYVHERARVHANDFASAGKAARHAIEADA